MRPVLRRGAIHAAKGGNSRREASIHADEGGNSFKKAPPKGRYLRSGRASGHGRRDRREPEFRPMGEYPLALRLANEFADLRAADADRIPLRAKRGRSPVRWRSGATKKRKHPGMGCFRFGGATRNRTGDEGFADLCLTAWLWRRMGESDRGCGALNRGSSRYAHDPCGEEI